MNPSGRQYKLGWDGYLATVTEVGATLRQLSHGGRDLVVPFDADQMMRVHRGALLAPWPNRIADGRYTFDGKEHQLPINEVDRHNAIHGLVSWVPWRLVAQTEDSVVLAYHLFPQAGYPFNIEITASYLLRSDGLTCSVRATNLGPTQAPYGVSAHPYLVAGPGLVNDWTLEVPAESVLEVTPDRLLPVGVHEVAGELDFRSPRVIGETALDHAYTGLTRSDGIASVRVTSPTGTGVECRFGEACDWVQVHTADRPDPAENRIGLAVEPMTCPPDAFNSRMDLIRLAPGASHTASWSISAIG